MYTLYIYTENEDMKKLYDEKKNYGSDSGFDCYCPYDITVDSLSQEKIDLQIKCCMKKDSDHTSVGYILMPRSSISKTPLRMSNSIGLVDKDYRGNLCAFVDNIKTTSYLIGKGDRLFQIISPTLEPISCVIVNSVEELGLTQRGEGGFGSTGK